MGIYGRAGLSDVIVAPSTRDLKILAGKLTQWMAARLPGASDLRLADFSYPKGAGQSHETILFDAHWHEGGSERSQGCVVRIKPSEFTVFPDNLFDEQYKVMKALHEGRYVRVARPLWFEEDPSVLGAPFFVMEKARGKVPVSIPPYARTGWLAEATPAQQRHLWEGAVRQLAAIQLVPLSEVQFLAGPEHARDGLAQEWDKYTRFVDWVREDPRSEILDAALQRLKSLWPKNQPEGLVWGDARIGNMMFDENFEVVAVMDWEQPSLGGALHDLAWWITLGETMHGVTAEKPHLEGAWTREDTIALWREITGVPTDDIEWYEDFTRLKIACLGVRTASLKGWPEPTEAEMAKRLRLS
jgi:aminoglycoside phosphotransferase (APT) family kinase protein